MAILTRWIQSDQICNDTTRPAVYLYHSRFQWMKQLLQITKNKIYHHSNVSLYTVNDIRMFPTSSVSSSFASLLDMINFLQLLLLWFDLMFWSLISFHNRNIIRHIKQVNTFKALLIIEIDCCSVLVHSFVNRFKIGRKGIMFSSEWSIYKCNIRICTIIWSNLKEGQADIIKVKYKMF